MDDFTTIDVREELGNPEEELISSNRIAKVIEDEGSFYASVARVATIIANRFSLEADKRLGPVSVEYQRRAEQWLKIAEHYDEMTALNAMPFAGGISESDKESRSGDPDQTKPAFKRGMFEIGGTDDEDF